MLSSNIVSVITSMVSHRYFVTETPPPLALPSLGFNVFVRSISIRTPTLSPIHAPSLSRDSRWGGARGGRYVWYGRRSSRLCCKSIRRFSLPALDIHRYHVSTFLVHMRTDGRKHGDCLCHHLCACECYFYILDSRIRTLEAVTRPRGTRLGNEISTSFQCRVDVNVVQYDCHHGLAEPCD